MTDSIYDEARALLRQALDNPAADFRDGQWAAIQALVAARSRLLVVQRTGWGKSLVYFLATRLLRDRGAGPTLLVSPLLALMRNQILAAERLGLRAVTINSSNKEEWTQVTTELQADAVDILLISPERLANDEFRDTVLLSLAARVGCFVVDEAHCISDWGHDFRPDYQRIARILQALPRNIPVLATTATANNRVVADVAAQLGPGLRVVRGPLVRESLRLQNIVLPHAATRLAWLAEQIPLLPGSGIIYTLTVRDSQRVAAWLQTQGIDAHAYWGSPDSSERAALEQRLLDNGLKVLVATSALGMGFDKPDLGFVIHYQRPGSVVHYYQQVGRAGRALDQAYGILFSGNEDQEILDYFVRTAFPPDAHVSEVLEVLRRHEGLSIRQIEAYLNLSHSQIEKVLKSLSVKSPAPVSKEKALWYATPVAYQPDPAKIAALLALRRAEQDQMQTYMQSRTCLMQFLAQALDDPDPQPCGKCAVCRGAALLPERPSLTLVARAQAFLAQSEEPIAPRQRWIPSGPIKPPLQEGRALARWGDEGWGALVWQGKQHDGRFADELVAAAVALIRARWQPDPAPTWVTCVPSLNHPDLVPDFARRLANSLGLPFVPCISKVRPTQPQKVMENSAQQVTNLTGAFVVATPLVQAGAVLLVDDIVDSRWTLTVVGSLLLQAGSGPVFPLALADSAKNSDA